ncbi:hypothetical protein BURMUCF2_2596 [Burkholderia multivorans CF2]|nr:hypothetical protein BURMUCF2_2596 [Burkholderia multivorans CF2]
MASPEKGPAASARRHENANDRAMTARAPQSAVRSMALRAIRNDHERTEACRAPRSGPRV